VLLLEDLKVCYNWTEVADRLGYRQEATCQAVREPFTCSCWIQAVEVQGHPHLKCAFAYSASHSSSSSGPLLVAGSQVTNKNSNILFSFPYHTYNLIKPLKPPDLKRPTTTANMTTRDQEVPLRYGLLLFPQFEILDAFGPIEALNTLAHSSSFPWRDDLDFAIIAETLDPVSSGPVKGDPSPFNPRIAQSVVPTHTFANAPDLDVLIVPGGFGTGPKLTGSEFDPDVDAVVDYIATVFDKIEYLISMSLSSLLSPHTLVLAALTLPYFIPAHDSE
jgi:putative intracellular protease/amidase